MKSRDELPCEHAFSLHANFEMVADNISETEVKEVIRDGARTRNTRGPGYMYNRGTVTVVAESEPCHHFIVTTFRDDPHRPSIKDKSYRRRRHSRRGQKGMQCSRCGKAQLSHGSYPLNVSGREAGVFEGYQCPNCLLTFYSEESSRRIREIVSGLEARPLTPGELSLMLLAATDQPVRGAISFMKEAFLLVMEVLPRFDVPVIPPRFIPFHYGPYSFDLVDAWDQLEEEGLMVRTGRSSTNKETFHLTPEGLRTAGSLMASLPAALRERLPVWRRGLDELGNDGILKDVYIKYPQYTDRSKIKELVLPRGMRRRA